MAIEALPGMKGLGRYIRGEVSGDGVKADVPTGGAVVDEHLDVCEPEGLGVPSPSDVGTDLAELRVTLGELVKACDEFGHTLRRFSTRL